MLSQLHPHFLSSERLEAEPHARTPSYRCRDCGYTSGTDSRPLTQKRRKENPHGLDKLAFFTQAPGENSPTGVGIVIPLWVPSTKLILIVLIVLIDHIEPTSFGENLGKTLFLRLPLIYNSPWLLSREKPPASLGNSLSVKADGIISPKKIPATSYSPARSPKQYHWRWRA